MKSPRTCWKLFKRTWSWVIPTRWEMTLWFQLNIYHSVDLFILLYGVFREKQLKNNFLPMFFFIFLKSVSGDGTNSHMTPMSKQSMGSMGSMDMGYAGANNMANNGLSANQNQVRSEVKCCTESWRRTNRELKTFMCAVKAANASMRLTLLAFLCIFLSISVFPCHTAATGSRPRDAPRKSCVWRWRLLFSTRCWVWSKAALTSKASASKSSSRDSVGSVWLSLSKF